MFDGQTEVGLLVEPMSVPVESHQIPPSSYLVRQLGETSPAHSRPVQTHEQRPVQLATLIFIFFLRSILYIYHYPILQSIAEIEILIPSLFTIFTIFILAIFIFILIFIYLITILNLLILIYYLARNLWNIIYFSIIHNIIIFLLITWTTIIYCLSFTYFKFTTFLFNIHIFKYLILYFISIFIIFII